jgi:hypothetical protein
MALDQRHRYIISKVPAGAAPALSRRWRAALTRAPATQLSESFGIDESAVEKRVL